LTCAKLHTFHPPVNHFDRRNPKGDDKSFIDFIFDLQAGDIDDLASAPASILAGKAGFHRYALFRILPFHVYKVSFEDNPVMNIDMAIDRPEDRFVRRNDVVI
jgi:hypothetical protein